MKTFSQIAAAAHAIARTIKAAKGCTYRAALSEGMKQAWAEAKAPVAPVVPVYRFSGSSFSCEIPQQITTSKGTVATVYAKYWEGGSNTRAYISVRFPDGSGDKMGYVCLTTGKSHIDGCNAALWPLRETVAISAN